MSTVQGQPHTEATKKKMNAATGARMRAISRLIDLHPDEYADILAAERVSAGLTANPDLEKKQKQLAAARAKVEALQRELEGQQVPPGRS